ncbi:MAG: hypothetical protein IJV56_01175, partial [Neisseriaceae bacterium]|nr:hypothetical protein [Neisseriaceae bacterium]
THIIWNRKIKNLMMIVGFNLFAIKHAVMACFLWSKGFRLPEKQPSLRAIRSMAYAISLLWNAQANGKSLLFVTGR